MEREVIQLREEMNTILAILDARRQPLELTDAEAISFYRVAENYAQKGDWPPHIEPSFADYILRVRLKDLAQLEKLTGDKDPWRPLCRLAVALEQHPHDKRLGYQLGAGRSNIEKIAFLWVAERGVSERAFTKMVETETKPLQRLLKSIRHKRPQEE
jgi:hypothetical protein